METPDTSNKIPEKGQYSKWIVALVIFLNVAFAVGVLYAMQNGADEPSTLIKEWFKWTGLELGVTGGVKIAKIASDAIKTIKSGNLNNNSSGDNAVG